MDNQENKDKLLKKYGDITGIKYNNDGLSMIRGKETKPDWIDAPKYETETFRIQPQYVVTDKGEILTKEEFDKNKEDQQWISIDNDLPTHEQRIVVKSSNGNESRGYLSYNHTLKGNIYWCVFTAKIKSKDVTHWKPELNTDNKR